MGNFSSRYFEEVLDETIAYGSSSSQTDDSSPRSRPRLFSPADGNSVCTPKCRVLQVDPRSPTEGIIRTPIEVLSTTPEQRPSNESENCTSELTEHTPSITRVAKLKKLEEDPRSPALDLGFVRTPIKVIRKHLQGRFIDSLRVFVKGGAGGMGLPKYGGIGGKGGDVFVVAKEGVGLKDVQRRFPTKRVVAGNGASSQQRRILGESGANVTFEAPIGVSVFSETGRLLGEFDADGTVVQVAKGGLGGCPTSGYSGAKGEAHSITLDLKLIADVGLVGFPNAGKSTLLKALSRASPKIASYPFTTIRPNIGIMHFDDLRQISVADLPGLIEGAHANIGMGHRFLKHVERTKLLLLVVDINGFKLGPQYHARSCLQTVVLLNKELELYKPELLDKPALLLVNKMDTEGAMEKFNEIKYQLGHLAEVSRDMPAEIFPDRWLNFEAILPASAGLGTGIREVKQEIRNLLDEFVTDHNSEAQLTSKLQAEIAERGPVLI